MRALLIHAESEQARDFYLHLAEFEPSPGERCAVAGLEVVGGF